MIGPAPGASNMSIFEGIKIASLIVGLLLSTAKALKFGGVLGPGEFLLTVFLSLSIYGKFNVRWNVFKLTLAFWVVFLGALLLGYLLRPSFGPYEVFPRSLIAYGLCMAVSVSAAADNSIRRWWREIIIAYFWSVAFVALSATIAQVSGVERIGPLELFWQGTERFQGWSTDPNQFAIMFIAIPFLGLYLWRRDVGLGARIRWDRIGIAVAWIALFSMQRLTDSDSLKFAWLSGALVFLAFLTPKLDASRKVLVILLALTLLLFNIGRVASFVEISLQELFEKDEQGDVRIAIWRESIDLIAQSPIVGFGPESGPLSSSGVVLEAHNNILHIGLSAGIVGILALCLFFIGLLVIVGKRNVPELTAAIIAMFIFGMTHTTVRHPIYWATLIIICVVAVSVVPGQSTTEYQLPSAARDSHMTLRARLSE